ncbi:MAG: hypothetical protein Q7O66_19910, partial [Dehalococcoidia bacterium]|nr:hypothetical protein [Dehalococcoidia bacterium]
MRAITIVPRLLAVAGILSGIALFDFLLRDINPAVGWQTVSSALPAEDEPLADALFTGSASVNDWVMFAWTGSTGFGYGNHTATLL